MNKRMPTPRTYEEADAPPVSTSRPIRSLTVAVRQGIARSRFMLVLTMLSMFCLAFATAEAQTQTQASAPLTTRQIEAAHFMAPRAFRAAVEQVMPSVVTIETFGGAIASPTARRQPGQSRPSVSGGLSRPGEGPTTGVIISEDGYIITSTYNFLRNPNVITVTLNDDSQYVARLLGRDETRKICLLKIDTTRKLPAARFLDRNDVRVGQWSISVGVGYGGEEPAMSAGIVSASSRILGRAIQTDANISPANYGGPLIDLRGRVLGICVPLSPQGTDAMAGVEWYDSGIGFAIPFEGIEAVLEPMKQGITVKRGLMGVSVGPRPDGARGVVIQGIAPNSPAVKAQLQPQDIILQIGGVEIEDLPHMQRVLGRYYAGQKVMLLIQRGEEQMAVEVELVDAVQAQPRPGGRAGPRRPGTPTPSEGEPPAEGDAPEDGASDEAPAADTPDAPQAPDAPDQPGTPEGADDAPAAEPASESADS